MTIRLEHACCRVVMPPGAYWVGDPCYAFKDHDRWIKWLNESGSDAVPHRRILFAEVGGRPVVGVGTAYGDGEYYDRERNGYPVDAGLLGAVPVDAADCEPAGMRRVEFASHFVVAYVNGVVHIGNIEIDTVGGDDDEEGGE